MDQLIFLFLFDLCGIQRSFGLFAVNVSHFISFFFHALAALLFYLGLTDDQRAVGNIFYFKIGFNCFGLIFRAHPLQNDRLILINRLVKFRVQKIFRPLHDTQPGQDLADCGRQGDPLVRFSVRCHGHLKCFRNMDLHFIIDPIVHLHVDDVLSGNVVNIVVLQE